jgi:aspartyl-tRNA(Asn)/glutamyl-tRNA(Gln) amidotransferase subunit C
MAGPAIDRALVLHVAKLASLSLSDSEADRLAGELAKIVGYVAQLDALDTRDVPPTAHVQIDRTPWRQDEPRPGLSHEDALAQAPRVEGDGFAVPAFVEEK